MIRVECTVADPDGLYHLLLREADGARWLGPDGGLVDDLDSAAACTMRGIDGLNGYRGAAMDVPDGDYLALVVRQEDAVVERLVRIGVRHGKAVDPAAPSRARANVELDLPAGPTVVPAAVVFDYGI